jgi:hypothetical protein
MKFPTLILWMVATALHLAISGSWAHEDDAATRDAPPERLGQVDFRVTCNAPAQSEFNRAMALFHSFWFDPAKKSFAKVLDHDPSCAMAQWGIAFMSMGNPFAWPANPNAMKSAAAAADEAHRIGAGSARERDYIEAMGQFFKDWETIGHANRAVAWEQAMAEVARRHPMDIEAQIIHALLLDATASPNDKTFARQLKAAAILEPLFLKYPHHPGIPHYLIHTYDYAGLAMKGLPAARIYASIAPSVPHALHMPSHIFSRVGFWEELIAGNRASYNAAMSELSEKTLGIGAYDALHAMDYMVFGHLQIAQDNAAQTLANELAAIRKVNVENFVAAYAFASIPSRIALEHNDWRKAAALELSPSNLAWVKFPQAEAVLIFARGLGAARSGDIPAAHRDVQRLQELKDNMTAAKIAYWAGQTDFQIKTVNAWIAFQEKRHEEALQLMYAAAQSEEASDKHPVTPGNIVPSRELLAEMLMALGLPAKALAEYERSLKRDANRFRSIYGAGRAAEAADNLAAARVYFTRLQDLTAKRDSDRPEIAYAQSFLARQ